MQSRKNIKYMLILFCALFVLLCAYLLYILNAYGTRWVASPYNTHISGVKDSVQRGSITDRTGVVLAETDENGTRQYARERAVRRALCHIVGDTYGQTLGAEAAYSQYLLGLDLPLSERAKQYRAGTAARGSNVALTVDAALSRYVYECMDEYWGAVVVMNYKTGEILASVSQPTFDPEKMEAYLSGETALAGSAMVNRVSMGRYTPGSTFKLVTLTAALRYIHGVEDMEFDCSGPLAFDIHSGKYLPDVQLAADYVQPESAPAYDRQGEFTQDTGAEPAQQEYAQERYNVVRDYHSEYHGTITLNEAVAESCNTTFARLAMQLGRARMQRTARELGIGEEFSFADTALYKGGYDAGSTELELAWSGIGQHKDLMTPLQSCMLSGAIANGGIMMEPKLLYRVTTPGGTVKKSLHTNVVRTLFSQAEASKLQGYMRGVVEHGTGTQAALKGLDVCGKTGTAEVSSDKTVKSHAWFTGFIADEEHPLCICVVLEQAGGGGSKAAPLAGKVLKKAAELGY